MENIGVLLALVVGLVLAAVFLVGNVGGPPKHDVPPPVVKGGPFTKEEVAEHGPTADRHWIIVDGKVYDVTDYLDEHPGGEALLKNAGGDATAGFKGPQHPPTVWDVIELYYIGDLKQ